jgi:hypothetical protein
VQHGDQFSSSSFVRVVRSTRIAVGILGIHLHEFVVALDIPRAVNHRHLVFISFPFRSAAPKAAAKKPADDDEDDDEEDDDEEDAPPKKVAKQTKVRNVFIRCVVEVKVKSFYCE